MDFPLDPEALNADQNDEVDDAKEIGDQEEIKIFSVRPGEVPEMVAFVEIDDEDLLSGIGRSSMPRWKQMVARQAAEGPEGHLEED